jgi:hypothetical protein
LKPFAPARAAGIVALFLAGFASHMLYQRWNPPPFTASPDSLSERSAATRTLGDEPRSFPVTFVPLLPPASMPEQLPAAQAREVEKIRALVGNRARIRGRVFRVGHSAKSNTYFLNFGPSREALTAVIFASAVELFEKKQLQPKTFAGKEVEVQGEIKDHPQYGLEVILESPAQIKILE